MAKLKTTVAISAGHACMTCPIRHNAVCAHCEPDELAILERIKTYDEVEAGAPIAHAGDPMTRVATIVSGAATLSRTLEDGRRQIAGLLLPSDFIGRPWRDTVPFDVTAASPVLLCRFERAAFEEILAATPRISDRLLSMALDELDAARDWRVILGRFAAREKIASFFLIVARRLGHPIGVQMEVELPLTREAMADMLGLTIETTSRQITAMKRDGLIDIPGRGRLIVRDMHRLAEEALEDDDGGMIA